MATEVSDYIRMVLDEPQSHNHDDHPDTRPSIDAGDQNLERVSDLAWKALVQANTPPRLFRFGAARGWHGARAEGAQC